MSSSETWAAYLLHRTSQRNTYIHDALVRAVGYSDYTPNLDITKQLIKLLTNCFDPITKLHRLDGDSDEILEKNKHYERDIDEGATTVLNFIKTLHSLALLPSSTATGDAEKPFALSEYRHLALHLAADLLFHYGKDI